MPTTRTTRSPRPAPGGLSPKEQLFVSAYSVCWNATRAAIEAGYSVKTAAQIGYELLRKPQIAAAVDALLEARKARYETTADNICRRLAQFAFTDVAELFVPGTTTLLPLTEMGPDARATIAGFEHGYTSSTRGRRGNKRTREAVVKVKHRDAIAALDLMARIRGLLKDAGVAPPYTGPAFILPEGTKVAIR